MSFHYERIVLSDDLRQYTVSNGDDSRILAPLSKINVFVGANNSGKSRFVRELVTFKKFFGVPPLRNGIGQQQIANAERLLRSLKDHIVSVMKSRELEDVENFVAALTQVDALRTAKREWIPAFYALLIRMHETRKVVSWRARAGGRPDGLKAYAERVPSESNAQQHLNQLLNDVKPYGAVPPPQKLYVPILRGLRPIQPAADVFQQRTKEDYFKDSAVQIFTGQTLYEEVQQLLLGNLAEREAVAEFQKFISTQFFDSQPLALIPKLKTRTLEVKIGDEIELPIHQLGDGIQSILILTFPLFKHLDAPLMVFYEEPEMFMHPGVQRVFLNTLTTFSNHQFFLTTHSNHFLDITLDVSGVSVFTVRKRFEESSKKEKEATFEIENVSSGHESCLELLGVRNSSVFLSNCTIWVEGITDRRYLAHYLKLYVAHRIGEMEDVKDFKEDLHYSFVEYGGANITHWSFLDSIPDAIDVKRLCSRLFLISDRDTFANGGKARRHDKLLASLGEQRFHLLHCKEIENLLRPNVLKRVVASYEGTDAKLKDVQQKDYRTKPLGTFIETELLAGQKQRRGSYAAESGTVSDKLNFCDKAIAETKSFAHDLSTEAQTLTKKIYAFIVANNE